MALMFNIVDKHEYHKLFSIKTGWKKPDNDHQCLGTSGNIYNAYSE